MPRTTEDGIAVAVYSRFSTDRQDARSIDDQIRRCRAYATSWGYRVVAEYKDAAISGAHVERAEMQRLLAAARSRGGPPFRAVLVDDLSRLSRDLGDTWQIVFRDLASADVKVVDVTTGLASDGAGARLTFGAMALVNDTFLQLVRAETHRGLEGRALGGFWTGGRCYGYSTVTEENPPDPEHPRKRSVIEPVEAALVVRVFRLFANGSSLKKIASTLNEEGLAAPNDGGRGNKKGHGWGHTTIRAMLCNERYLGRFTWNQSKWVRVPGRKSRRRVKRPEAEWVSHEYPELAIVPRDLWDAAQARFRRVYATARGRPAGTGHHVHLVSGLMRCGVCGGSMTIVGRKAKAGVSYARFGCTAHASRGASICANSLSVSEKKASRTLVNALKEKLDRPEVMERFVSTFKQRAASLRSGAGVNGADDVERRVRDCERRVANLTESLAKLGWSDALASKLREEEAQLGKLKSERSVAAKERGPRVVPHPAAIAAYLKNLLALLETDPVRGRELLSRFVAPIVMTPETEGPVRRYRATGAFNLSFFLAGAAASESGSGKSGCAGRI
ncbi:MAG: recombinase family protein [Myxococcales bacterium]|nr:recombinase family protein [Myxococcales bacterium]